MNRKFKKELLQRKFIIFIIIILAIISILFIQNKNYKYTLFYKYQTVPDIELQNTLSKTKNSWHGNIAGFVKFNNLKNQPKDLKQYYIIKVLEESNKNKSKDFLLEEIIKLDYLPPKNLGTSKLTKVNETNNILILEDENSNQFFFNKITKKVSIKDINGDNTTLITNNSNYRDFIKKQLF